MPHVPAPTRVDAKMFSMREKKVILDASGRPVAGLKKKLVSLKPALQLFRGGDFAQPVATIKWVLPARRLALGLGLGAAPRCGLRAQEQVPWLTVAVGPRADASFQRCVDVGLPLCRCARCPLHVASPDRIGTRAGAS